MRLKEGEGSGLASAAAGRGAARRVVARRADERKPRGGLRRGADLPLPPAALGDDGLEDGNGPSGAHEGVGVGGLGDVGGCRVHHGRAAAGALREDLLRGGGGGAGARGVSGGAITARVGGGVWRRGAELLPPLRLWRLRLTLRDFSTWGVCTRSICSAVAGAQDGSDTIPGPYACGEGDIGGEGGQEPCRGRERAAVVGK